MQNEEVNLSRRASLGRHLRKNLVAYIALFVAVSMTPLPSQAAGAVAAKLKNNSVKTKHIAALAVTNAKIANDAVTTYKIKNGQVTKADLAPTAWGYRTIVARQLVSENLATTEISNRAVPCKPGEVAVGGGAYVTPAGQFPILGSTAGQLVRSFPVSTLKVGNSTFTVGTGDGSAPTGWRTIIENDTAGTEDAVHYAICATK